MRFLILISLFLFTQYRLAAQDSITHRIILIGDAGEMNTEQQAIISDAATKILSEKTTVFFLGDNIYPRGMGLPGTDEELRGQTILQSQFKPMRKEGAPVYFIPGNHDWDRMGKDGLIKIKQQWQYIEDQNDSLLKLIPLNGCPDPIEINLTEELVVIAFDSEWWLFPFDKKNPDADCDCTDASEVIGKLEDLYYKNRYKTILLASHHPFQSYGTHGGYFSWKDHLFPLTSLNHKLYIPLPGIGSLYPLLRKTFTNPEDLRHPLYKNMVQTIDKVFSTSPNLLHVAGHEHGLQFIDNPKTGMRQIVSGGGAKDNHTIKKKYSLYGRSGQGYVIADFTTNQSIKLTYLIYENGNINTVFTHYIPIQNSKRAEKTTYPPINGDSVTVTIRPAYNNPGKIHRKIFGENYRQEFSSPVTLPVIRISQINGGLTPEKRGGGMQTISLRLRDHNGKEWVLRNLEKNPDPLLPDALRKSFARDLLDDYMSAQHPFAALIVPTLANAAGVPHANPLIGLVAPDTALGIYQKLFAGKVALFEEREPLGKSENSIKTDKALKDDNDNKIDGQAFFKARLLDLLIGDWDRHPDQWRWVDTHKGKNKLFTAVPRDRDQALYRKEGLLPSLASRSWILPTLQGFDRRISKVKYSLFKTNFVNAYLSAQLSHKEWTTLTHEFTSNITDELIDSAIRQLPDAAYNLRGKELSAIMKERRDNIPHAMEKFYRFIHRRVDLKATNKNELFTITGLPNADMKVVVQKIKKDGQPSDTLLSKVFEHDITKEIRVYMLKGDDSLQLNNITSPIKLRIIGGKGKKHYNIEANKTRIKLYDRPKDLQITGETQKVRAYLSKDSLNTAFASVNPYHITMPLLTGGFNLDDGLIIGFGVKHTHQGFRKQPYASQHQLLAAHSFSTNAYRIRYGSEWLNVVGKADILLNALIKAPDNTQNFFGRGNKTHFSKFDGFRRYYRTRFAIYQVDASLRWRNDKNTSFSVGPSIQWYRYDANDNEGRFITNNSLIGSYDSSIVDKTKKHAGIIVQFTEDGRNNKIFPSWGHYVNIRLQGYKGLNNFSRSFLQVIPEIAVYKSLNASQSIILANRLGGGISVGQTAFYQSLFIGGHENLLGYRQFRFAGSHSLYNNLECRIRLADFANYILPGQIGFTAFFDTGRVWEKDEDSKQWHTGVGGGLYFAPAKMAVLQLLAGYSREGWLPYFTFGFRF